MNKQIQEKFRKPLTRVKSIAFHPTQPVFITANHCGSIYIWNYFYKYSSTVLRDHIGSVRVVKFHPSGEYFATGGDDKILRVWNYKTKEIAHKFKGHTDYIRSLDFHPTQPWIISGSDDCTIKVWNYYSGEIMCSSSGHHHYIMAVLFVDSTHIMTGSLDHTIGLWNCSNLFEKSKKFMVPDMIMYQTIDAHDRGVNTLYLENGSIVSGSDDREIKIWRFANETLSLSKTLYSHEGNVTCVAADATNFYGVSEDGNITIYNGENNTKINVGTRLWSIAHKDGYLAVGTDDGLIVYKYSQNMLFATIKNDFYYLQNDSIYISQGGARGELYYKIKDASDLISISLEQGGTNESQSIKGRKLILQYEKKFEIIENKKRKEGDQGQIIIVNGENFSLKNGNLIKNEKIIKENLSGKLIASDSLAFYLSNKQVQLISTDENDQFLAYSTNYEVKDVKASRLLNLIALIGDERITLIDFKFEHKFNIEEKVEIIGGIFSRDLFIYTTLKQIKYFYTELGIIQSIEDYIKPVSLIDKAFFYLSSNGIEQMNLNLGEIAFRRSVAEDKDILSTIEKEQLPGLSPLEYLIKNGKGIIALPYINDKKKQFFLYLSDGNYEKAFSICDDDSMFTELANSSMIAGNFDIAERCFKKTKNFHNLFFLYICTKQFEKLNTLEGDELDPMVKIVLEDKTLFADNKIVNIDKIEEDSTNSLNEKLKDLEIKSQEKQGNSIKLDNKFKSSDLSNNLPTPNFKEINIKKPERSSENSNVEGDALFSSEEKDNIDDNCSVNSSNNTNCATNNDSEINIHLFDLSKAKEYYSPIEKSIEEEIEKGLKLYEEKDYNKAFSKIQNILAHIALNIKNNDEKQDMREKLGAYLFAIKCEKQLGNSEIKKQLEILVFKSKLPLEACHCESAKIEAMNFCFKNKNFKTAKEIAKKIKDKTECTEIFKSSEKENDIEMKDEELMFDTLEPCSNYQTCLFCSIKFQSGEICQACRIGLIE